MYFIKLRISSLIALCFILSVPGFSQNPVWNNLNVGENLIKYIKDIPPKIRIEGKPFVELMASWPEAKIDYLTFGKEVTLNEQKIMSILDKYFIGVLQSEDEKDYLLIDTDGDGILNVKTRTMFVPVWVVARNSINKQADSNITAYFLQVYELFNSAKGPFGTEEIPQLTKKMDPFALNTEKPSRDIIYAMTLYFLLNGSDYDLSLQALDYAADEMNKRFNTVPPIVSFLKILADANLGNYEKARSSMRDFIKANNSFIPAKILNALLLTNENDKTKKINELKKTYKGHWMFSTIN
jgi:hypothetical protein